MKVFNAKNFTDTICGYFFLNAFLDGYKDIRREDLCLKTLEKINEEGPRSQHLVLEDETSLFL